MKRYFINLAALFLGLVLGGFATYASAETIAATSTLEPVKWKVSGASYYDDPAASCSASWSGSFVVVVDWSAVNCRKDFSGTVITMGQSHAHCPVGSISPNGCTGTVLYTCPAGQNWTLSGANCTRPDCVAPEVRQSDGTCAAPPCSAGMTSSASRFVGTFATGSGTSVYGVATPVPSSLCDGTCSGSVQSVTSCNAGTAVQGTPVECTYSITLNGSTCSGGNGSAPVDPLPIAPNPPCSAGQGVISNTGGKVVCVNQGSEFQGATYPPKENKTTSTKTFSDGSTQTTNNIQTCTGEGACSTSTTVVNTAATGGGVGQAGPIGTTTTGIDKPKSETSDFCAQFPTLQICKGGMNEEATQKEVRDELKKLTTPNVSDDSAITGATHSQQSGDDNQAETDKLMDVAEGNFDPTTANRSAWADALSSGWLTPVPASTCSPYTATFSGKTWTWDYCPTAAKISEIGAYALWFMFSVGVFVMLTGGRNAST
ncbi:MAG: hypothetical protein E6Q97_03855 [Desulfurellales bacterium]|nr:MAG: hypothetical protein E6Q97_03855 [Desulfurellales bacterium]